MVAQIVFGRIRNIFDVFKRLDMLGFESDLIEPLLIHGHALVRSRSRFRSIFSISGLNIAILSLFPH